MRYSRKYSARLFQWALLALSLVVAPNAHAGGYVDVVLDQAQVTPTFTTFRNDNYVIHIGGLTNTNGTPVNLTHPRCEYFKPTDGKLTKWLTDMYGEHVTTITISGRVYNDLSKAANRAALVRSEKRWMAAQGADWSMVDCIMETPPGQNISGAYMIRDMKAAGIKVLLNTGDPFAAAQTDTTNDAIKPWALANYYSDGTFVQVGFDTADIEHFFMRMVMSCSVANSRSAAGKLVIIGVFDLDGKNAQMAQQFFSSDLFKKPLVYKHYNTSYDPKVNVGLELPGGKAVVEPVPTTLPSLGINSNLNGAPLYRLADNWWNLRVDQAPVDPNNATIINTIKSYPGYNGATGVGAFHPDFTPTYGIPYVVVDNATPLSSVTFNYASESDKVGYPIPTAAKTSGAYYENGELQAGGTGDRHMLLLNRDTWVLSELSYTNWNGTSWSAGAGAVFELKTNNNRPQGWTSTDAAGLAVLPGLVRPDEVIGGSTITHATRFSIKRTNGYVWPASHAGASDSGAPPLGLRLRLKASYDTSWAPAYLRPLLESWKVYGLICADRGGNCYVQGVMSSQWDNNTLNPALHRLHITDFEVVQLGWKPTT